MRETSTDQKLGGPGFVAARLAATCLVMGDDVILPEDIVRAYGFSYAEDQLRHFAETVPSENVIRHLSLNGFVLISGPPSPMSLLDMRRMDPELFYEKTGNWYTNREFARDDKVASKWIAIRKRPVPGSVNLNWVEQTSALKFGTRVPNAAELLWLIISLFKVRGRRPFKPVYARTSSVDSYGNQVSIGDVGDSSGLSINIMWGNRDLFDVGLALSLNLDLVQIKYEV